MARNDPVRYVSTFRAPSEYERQLEEARRRAMLAEALAQQQYEPQEGVVAPIPRAAPLVKALQGFMTARAGRKAKEAEEAAEKAGRREAVDYIRSFEPEQRNVGMGELAAMEAPTPMIEDGRISYAPPSAVAAPNQRLMPAMGPDGQPDFSQQMQMQVGGPLTEAQKRARALEGLESANPMIRAYAADLMKPPEAEEFYAPVVGAEGKYVQFGKRGGTRASDIAAPARDPAAVTTATIMKDGKPTVIDARTGNVIGAAVPTTPREERLVSVMGPQGPTYVRESEAVGMKPFTAQTLKQEQAEAAEEERKRGTSVSTQITLDNAAALLTHPGREAGTGASSWKANIPGTDARDFKAQLDTLKAQTFIPMVSALRGLGALSDAEGKKLLDAVGALDTGMSDEGFYDSLEKVIDEIYTKAKVAGLQVTRPLLPPNPYKKIQPATQQSSVMDAADAILGGG